MAEENERLKKATYKAFLILQVCQEMKLDELAAKLHVDRGKFEKALRKVKNFRIRKIKDEKIVSLREVSSEFSIRPAILWGLKNPEKYQGGTDLFRRLMSVDGEKRVAYFFYRLPDGEILSIETGKINEKLRLYVFTPLRKGQIEIEEKEDGRLEFKIRLDDPLIMKELLLLRDLLGVEGEWEYLGVYTVSFSNDFVKEALEAGGFIIKEFEESAK
ncbi:MAG: hypothetical protein QXG39_09665 [Candidatus Aenigmatarchaeota archaeon]